MPKPDCDLCEDRRWVIAPAVRTTRHWRRGRRGRHPAADSPAHMQTVTEHWPDGVGRIVECWCQNQIGPRPDASSVGRVVYVAVEDTAAA